jgi:hypothetical protein
MTNFRVVKVIFSKKKHVPGTMSPEKRPKNSKKKYLLADITGVNNQFLIPKKFKKKTICR